MARLKFHPQFHPRFVAFLDILGFKELTFKADTDIAARKTIRTAIGILRGANNDRTNSGYNFTHFSDSIVLTADVSSVGARAIFESCCRLYLLLLQRGLLLRGGLTVGNVIHQANGMLYGSGIIEAYNLDERGIPPRISVTNAACGALAEHCTDSFRGRYVIADDYDLSPMVNVLQEYTRLNKMTAKRDASILQKANGLASNIAFQSKNANLPPDNRAKWRWLQKYWNSSVTKHGIVSKA